MGDELRGESLVHLNVRFRTETGLKEFQDLLYEKSGQGISFTGLLEAMVNEVTIVTAWYTTVLFRLAWMLRRYAKLKNIVRN